MKEGDFIKIEYDAFVKETDQLMDTTHEEVAKEHDLYNERATYGPMSVVVGSGTLIKGLEEALKDAEVGKEIEVEIPPKDAFGDRDPKLIEVFPMNRILSLPEFRKGDQYPAEGMEIRINNRTGVISRIFAGRVRVDFNNRWAGRTLVYKFKVTELIEDRDDRMRALISSVYPHSEEFSFEFGDEDAVDIILPDIVKLDTNWAMAKFKLISDLRKYMDLRTIRLIEVYMKREEEEEHDHGSEHSHEHDDKAPAEKGSEGEKKGEEPSENKEASTDGEEKADEKKE